MEDSPCTTSDHLWRLYEKEKFKCQKRKELVTEALSDIAAYLPKLPPIIMFWLRGLWIRFQKAVVRLLRCLRLDDI